MAAFGHAWKGGRCDMAEWQTPKTDWNVESVPGPGDFRRIEGNTQHLKEQTDELATHRLMGKKIVLIASGTATITDIDPSYKTIALNNARDGDFLIASTRFDWEIHYGSLVPFLPVYYLSLRLPSGYSRMTASYQVIALRDA